MTAYQKINQLIETGQIDNIQLAIELIKSNKVDYDLLPYQQLFDWLNEYENVSKATDKEQRTASIVEYIVNKDSLSFYHNPFLQSIHPLCRLMPQLKQLTIFSCSNFSDFSFSFLSDNHRLQELHISYFDLQYKKLHFDKCPHLHFLSLNHCSLEQIPQAIEQLQQLQVIDLSQNPLGKFRGDIQPMHAVYNADFENCELEQIGSICRLFPQLNTLNISHNRLAYLDAPLGQLKQLYFLNCKYNQIQFVSAAMSACLDLTTIDLSHNLLEETPQVFNDMPYIQDLNLAHNQLRSFQLTEDAMLRLQKLDLSHNPIEKFPLDLTNAKDLQHLNLSATQIKGLTEHLRKIPTLKSLKISNCGLNFQDIMLLDNLKLQHLDIRKNNVTEIEVEKIIRHFYQTEIMA